MENKKTTIFIDNHFLDYDKIEYTYDENENLIEINIFTENNSSLEAHIESADYTCSLPSEVYSRVCGYMRPIDNWNKGKKEEFFLRKTFTNESMKDYIDDKEKEPTE